MFQNRFFNVLRDPSSNPATFALESLEGRQLLHGHGAGGHLISTIEFSQAPAVVQTGLTALASSDSLAVPTAAQTVYLGNRNGVETYTLDFAGTGTDTKITVDLTGAAVTAPVKSTTTFGAISNTAVTNEINAIATALGLTAPASTDSVAVSTPSSGAATYSIKLSNSSTTTKHNHGTQISVDANGNPVGNASIPFSAIPATIQTALNTNAPSGATAIDTTATQKVSVRTANGVTTYSVKFTATGTTSTVTVNSAGVLTSLPSASNTTFSAIPIVAQTELQTLATADGVSTAIDSTASVRANDEGNGTVIYSISLVANDTSGTGTHTITISVDQSGNPTVPPTNGPMGASLFGGTCFGGFRGFGRRGFGGF